MKLIQVRGTRQMVLKNLQAKRLTRAEVEMAVRAVEGIPNAMDMDFAGVDPDRTSLDVAPEGHDSVAGVRCFDHRHVVGACIVCGQRLPKD
jgi:hypothetical protein